MVSPDSGMKNYRKARPSMPRWWWNAQDGCWYCKNQKNCANCPDARRYLKQYGAKKHKGRTAGSKKLQEDE